MSDQNFGDSKLINLTKLKNEVRKKISNDPAHDFEHVMRVYKNAEKLAKKENANTKLVLCAVLLHDIVSFPKPEKLSKKSSISSAIKAEKILKKYNLSKTEIKIVTGAIRDHSFSQNKTPKTLEGKILQDADRLDAIGAIGIARAFAVAGAEGRTFYNESDPFCSRRKRVRKAAGTVGIKIFIIKNAIRPGYGSAPSSGNGPNTCHQNTKPATSHAMSMANEPICDVIRPSTTVGRWLASKTALKTANATSGRLRKRAMLLAHEGLIMRRSALGGVPAIKRGGATSVNKRYCAVWALSR